RIYDELRNQGYMINHKKVQRIMNEMDLRCGKFQRKSRYKSYKGTVGKVAKNRLNRRFNTYIPLQKIVTDVTEFKCSDDQKLYLIIKPLNQTIERIKDKAKYRTTIHSDQGWHYQHNTWVKALKKNKIFQSMSRKATCADNASMENFFGILKQEMYYGEKLTTYEELKH